jgi:UPF0755 protein
MSKKKPSPSRQKLSKVVKVLILFAVAGIIFGISDLYKKIYYPNVSVTERTATYIYIPTGATYDDVIRILVNNNILISLSSFEWVASRLSYRDHIRPGKYLVKKNMNNRELVSMLRAGRQTPVKLTFNNIRTREALASRLSRSLEPDSALLMELLSDDEYLSKFGFTSETVMAMFIPNTYELYWNTSADKLFHKMHKEYTKFWTPQHIARAEEIGLTQVQVSVLASIVEQETHKNDEKSTVAGVYMNRIKKGYKLEADPTLVYALGDFTIRRVLNAYKSLDSPYNTYKYAGLPPGPICMPSLSSLKAVLNYKKHDYFYFCAREDFSGYHVFARDYTDHLANARRYQKELNKRNIRS